MNLDYADELTDTMIDHLEEAARATGLPLRKLELIGQDPDTTHGFVESVRQGRHDRFLDAVDWSRLEVLLDLDCHPVGRPAQGGGPTAASA